MTDYHDRPFDVVSLEGLVPPEEWQARRALAALYRLGAHFGLTDTIYTHISLRIPGTQDRFLINSFGMLYEEVTASNLVEVDGEAGIVRDPVGVGVNRAGFIIHGALHRGRDDIHCVMHTHTPAGIAMSAQKHGLLPISQHAQMIGHTLAYHDYEGIVSHLEEQQRLVRDIGQAKALVLRNHGLLVAGVDPGETLYLMLTLELACRAQIDALAGGAELIMPSNESIATTHAALGRLDTRRNWSAMLRLLHRIGSDHDR